MQDLRTRSSHGRIDANWVPSRQREKRLLVSDMDSTLIPVECFDEVAEEAGVGDAVRALTARAMGGGLNFAEAYRERLRLCRGVSLGVFERVWRERVSLNPGAEVLVRTMAARGAKTLLVTGGFAYFAERVARRAGFDSFRSNDVVIEGDRMTGEAREPILDGDSKRVVLEGSCRARGVPCTHAVAIGDGANDAAMVSAAGLGVGWRAKPALRRVSDAVLDHSALDAVLALQGIPEIEFVSACA